MTGLRATDQKQPARTGVGGRRSTTDIAESDPAIASRILADQSQLVQPCSPGVERIDPGRRQRRALVKAKIELGDAFLFQCISPDVNWFTSVTT